MNKNMIRQVYDSIYPTQEQKNRMLRKILNASRADRTGNRQFKAGCYQGKWASILAAAALLLTVIGISAICIASVGNTQNPHFSDPVHASSGTDEVNGTENREVIKIDYLNLNLLEPVLEKYRTAVQEKWSFEECEAEQISYMCSMLSSIDQIGYSVMDLDGNGAIELIISDGNVIYDLYTQDGEAFIHVFSGAERNTYSLCEGNIIRNIGSSSAVNSVYHFYKLTGQDLISIDTLTTEESDEGICWYLNNFQVSMSDIPVDEATAFSIIDSYKVVPIEIQSIG